jgi:hypothetical protein
VAERWYTTTRTAIADEAGVHPGPPAGDGYHPTPYAYVSPWDQRTGPFWNAPFGALYPLNPAHDLDALASRIAEFFERGRKQVVIDRSAK